MPKNLIINWILCMLFVLSFLTGLGLHLAGHGSNPEVWHHWAVAHVITSLLWGGVCIYHIVVHGKWYRSLVKKGRQGKSKITAMISCIFVVVVITGIILLGVEGANSGIGLWHYKIGLLMGLFAVIHVVKRKTALLTIFKR